MTSRGADAIESVPVTGAAALSRVPLTGADCFLRAFDADVRRRNEASHLSQLVLRLGPGFAPEALRTALAEAVPEAPIVRAPLRRPRPFAAPVYRLDRASRAPLPAVVVHEQFAGAPDEIPPVFFERLNGRLDGRRGALLRFDVVPRPEGRTDLAMTWLHMLFDGAGSEAFVRWLDARARGPTPLPGGHGMGDVTPPPMGSGRGRQALAWQRHMGALGRRPPRSLAGPAARRRQRLRYDVETLSTGETERVRERARQKAGFLTPMLFYLAAVVRAHAAVFRARGVDPGSFVVPLPVNLRPKGAEGAVFRTHVSMLWFHVTPEETGTLPGLVESLKRQRREAIKAKLVEAGTAAMDYARHVPAPLYVHMARRTFAGELCSFFFAWTDEFLPGMTSFLGAPIRNAFHAPSVPPSPGSGAILSVREGRLNLTHVFQDDAIRPEERALLRAALREDLLGPAP